MKTGMGLPMDIAYFLESYETCLQFTEELEQALHEKWNSSERDEWKARQLEMKLPDPDEQE